MKYKRKSKAVVLSRDTEAAALKKDTEVALRRYVRAVVLSRDSEAAALKKDTEAALSGYIQAVALSRDTETALSEYTPAVAFIPAVLDGLTSVGLLFSAALTPVRYAEGYRTDIEMVGRDMWRAKEKFKHDPQKKTAEASTN